MVIVAWIGGFCIGGLVVFFFADKVLRELERRSVEQLEKMTFLQDQLKRHRDLVVSEPIPELIKVMEQFVLEVQHAQEVGPDWYTKGSTGLYQQVRMWGCRARSAIANAKALGGIE